MTRTINFFIFMNEKAVSPFLILVEGNIHFISSWTGKSFIFATVSTILAFVYPDIHFIIFMNEKMVCILSRQHFHYFLDSKHILSNFMNEHTFEFLAASTFVAFVSQKLDTIGCIFSWKHFSNLCNSKYWSFGRHEWKYRFFFVLSFRQHFSTFPNRKINFIILYFFYWVRYNYV